MQFYKYLISDANYLVMSQIEELINFAQKNDDTWLETVLGTIWKT